VNQNLNVLAIDDSQSVLQLIGSTLIEAHHNCQTALGPARAREILQDHVPDLILLDVEMPETSGIALCQELRGRPQLQSVPIIFVSADNRQESVLEGFAAGGTDYIFKPFQASELIARVEAHGYRARMEMELVKKTQELADLSRHQEDEIRQRTRDLAASQALAIDTLAKLAQTMSAQDELVRVRKLESLGALVADIAHEINTPLGNSLTLSTFMKFLLNSLTPGATLSPETVSSYCAESSSCLDLLIKNLTRISELIQRFRTVVADNLADSWASFDLDILIRECLTRLQPKLTDIRAELRIENPSKLETAGYPATLCLILENLIRNSAEHAFEQKPPSGACISIVAEVGDQTITIHYHDNGGGVAIDLLDKICDPFFTTKRFKGNTGLGLFIVHNQITGRLNGSLDLDRAIGTGFGCTIRFPRHLPKPEG
jgi:C4-dicarboxylate-specific signal transduction histidine kinase